MAFQQREMTQLEFTKPECSLRSGVLNFTLSRFGGQPRRFMPYSAPLDGIRAIAILAVLIFHIAPSALTGGFAMAGMFAYIAGSPFVFIELHGIAPQDYGWFFGANALGFVIVAQMNARLVRRFEMGRIMRAANLVQTIFGLALAALALTGAGGFWALAGALFGYIACIGLILPNASALAMAPHGERAGSAAALLGTLQFALAAVAAMSVGAIHDASALPMAGIIAICGALGALASRLAKKS